MTYFETYKAVPHQIYLTFRITSRYSTKFRLVTVTKSLYYCGTRISSLSIIRIKPPILVQRTRIGGLIRQQLSFLLS